MSEKDNLPKADGKKTQKKSPEGKQELNIVTDSNLKNTSEPNISPNTDTLELETVSKESVVNKVIAKTSDDKGDDPKLIACPLDSIDPNSKEINDIYDINKNLCISIYKEYINSLCKNLINFFQMVL